MLEIPESTTIGQQANQLLKNCTVAEVRNATSVHKFAFYYGDPADYPVKLTGKHIVSARGHGMFVDLCFEKDVYLTIGDGTIMRYGSSEEKHPDKYQLLIILDDGSFLVFTVAMYGGIWAYQGLFENSYHQGSLKSISPLNKLFDETFFEGIIKGLKKDLSVKAMLATEQRIPGVGNGVLQDILFNAGIHPRRKVSTLTDVQKNDLYASLKMTLKKMTDAGGRDTEKDLLGQQGGYRTLLSKNTCKDPCPRCGANIVKEAYLGGAVYFCPVCQPL